MSTTRPSFDTFDPNGGNVRLWGVWDVYCRFVVKPNRGGQLTRLRNMPKGKLYELTSAGWVLRALKDIDAHNDDCDLCHQGGLRAAWDAYVAHPNRYRSPSRAVVHANEGWAWKRQGGKITNPPELMLLCPDCKDATGWY